MAQIWLDMSRKQKTDLARCNQETERRPVSLEYKGLGRGGCRMLVALVLDYEIKEFQVLKGSPPSSSGAQ